MNPLPIIIGLLLVLFFAIIIVREATAVIIERFGNTPDISWFYS